MTLALAALPGLAVAIPGTNTLSLSHLLIDFNGTLACNGALIAGVAERLSALSQILEIEVLTGDTYGTVAQTLAGLPVRHAVVLTGADKTARVRTLLAEGGGVAALGNGRNDVDMLRAATLGIAVLGPECTHALTLAARNSSLPTFTPHSTCFCSPSA
jgi:Soluble P-type ATPase